VVRYPLDFSFAVRRFLDTVGPDFVALMELEVWPNFVRSCVKRGVPVCVINGRISARSFGRYNLIAPLLRPTFRRLAAAAAQTRDYAERFAALGVPADRVQVLDTMKWDTANIAEPASVAGAAELAAALGVDRSRPVVVVGSSAPQEHQLLIDACPDQAQMILVPRKPEWFDDVARRLPGVTRRTQSPDGTRRDVNDPATRDARGRRFFLLDTIGELRKAYALADVAVVGRSFGGLYGSDMIEPIALGRPTIIGPCHSDFADTMAAFLEGEGIVVAADPAEPIARLLLDRAAAAALAERGRRVILSRQGATLRHARLIRRLIEASTNH
jgi:3-deoxy-D-manno-octulosonic-acid transferase